MELLNLHKLFFYHERFNGLDSLSVKKISTPQVRNS